MGRARSIDDWLAYIERADTTDGVRRVLREYAKGRRGGRIISRSRREVAQALGISERRVTAHLKRARADGLYIVVTPGWQGRTAVYEATFGTPEREGFVYSGEWGWMEGVPAQETVGVPAPDCSDFGGSHHYYDREHEHPDVARRSQLIESTFAGSAEERESVNYFSLSSVRRPDVGTCRGCGGPLDVRSAEIGFTVGDCCVVVVDVQHEAARAVEEDTA